MVICQSKQKMKSSLFLFLFLMKNLCSSICCCLKKKKKSFFYFSALFLCVLESCAIGPRLKKSLFYYSFLGLYPSARNSKKKRKEIYFFFSFVVVVFLSANGSVIRAGAEENDRDVGVSTSRRPNVCVTRLYTFTLFSFPFFFYTSTHK